MKKLTHAHYALILIFALPISIALFLYAGLLIADSFEDNRGFFCFNIGLLVAAVMAGIWMIKTKRI